MMSSSVELVCEEIVELVTTYLEGALSETDHARFDSHLADCPYCRIYLDQMRLTIRTLGSLPTETIPPAIRDELVRRFRDWRADAG